MLSYKDALDELQLSATGKEPIWPSKESTLRARSSINSAKASQSTASEKTSNCESAFFQEHEQLNSLEARFSKIEEEREQLAVEIQYLQAKDAEFLKQQNRIHW